MKGLTIRFIALIGLLSIVALPVHAQQRGGRPGGSAAQGSVQGSVVDATTKTPLASATVALWRAADSTLVTGAIATDEGAFSISALKQDDYYLQVSFIGYETLTVSDVVVNAASPHVDLGKLALGEDRTVLEEVEVTAERHFMEVEVDRTVYNTKDQIVSSGGSASDVLQNIPSVEVDIDGKVSLRGNQNVAVMINGRPSPMTSEALASFLQGLSGEMVERVEVIPNPSAKYEPDGMAGILNIVLKKNTDLGVSGGFSAGMGTQDNYNASGNINYMKGKFNVFANYGFRYGSRASYGSLYRENRYFDPYTYLDQAEEGTSDRWSHNLNTNIDYKLSDKNTLSFMSILSTRPSQELEVNDYLELDESQDPTGSFRRISEADESDYSFDQALSFRRVIEPGRDEFFVEARFDTEREKERSSLNEYFAEGEEAPSYSQSNQVNSKTYSGFLQADYTKSVKETGKLEAGFRSTYRRLNNDLYSETLDHDSGSFIPDLDLNNTFVYDEQVHAAYGIYGQDFGKFSGKLGFRLEQALTDFNLETTQETFNNNYFSVFPSAFLVYSLTETNQLKASYSKRVNRPRSRMLNPFSNFDDPLNRRVGNPYLKPEYIHALEVGYTRFTERTSLTLTPYFRRTTNRIRRHLTVDENGVSTLTFENFDTSDSWGLESIGTFQIRGKVNAFVSFNAYRIVTDGSNVDASLSNDAFGWTTRLNATYTVRPGLDLQASYFYRAPLDIEGGRMGSFSAANIAIRQKLLGDQASVSLRVNDVFDTMGMNFWREDSNFYQEMSRSWGSRMAMVTFTYNFGKQRRPSRQRRGDNNGGGGSPDDIEF